MEAEQNCGALGGADVVVVEDVAGAALDDLARRRSVVSDPTAWADPARLGELLTGARALVVRNRTQVTRHVLESGSGLQVVARAGVGLDNVDLKAADDLGVVVVAAIGANATSVGEHALAMALALARDLVSHDSKVRSGVWDRQPGRELSGRTWGVVGLGATGRATAQLAKAIGMHAVGYDPFLAADPVAGVERVAEQRDLLARADVVSLHLAVSDQTRGMVGDEFLATMRSDAYLVNVARGELVDEAALLAALDAGGIAGAALDVRAQEPPTTLELALHPRCLSTPHVAGITEAAQERVVDMIAADIGRVLDGEEALHPVGCHVRAVRR